MTTEATTSRSRRAILAAAFGVAAASVASALGRPRPIAAAENDAVLVGGEYTGALSPTGITTTGAFAPGTPSAAFYASTTTSGTHGLRGTSLAAAGVRGDSTSSYGVHGKSTGGTGIWAEGNLTGLYASSASGDGVDARSVTAGFAGVDGNQSATSGYGVWAHTTNPTGTGIGVLGESAGDAGYGAVGRSSASRVGVLGVSNAVGDGFALPPSPAKTGVYGRSTLGASARGVHGYSTSGRGVFGQATTGTGLYGVATTGYAIRSSGRVRFDKAAGIATLGATATSIVVTPGTALTATSAVTATLMSDAGTVMVRRVAVNTGNGTFTIFLTGSAAAGTKVAWHVFG